MRRCSPDRALQRHDELASTLGFPRAQQLTMTQGRVNGDACATPGCAGDAEVKRVEIEVRRPIKREGVIVNWATTRVFEKFELRCSRCAKPWPVLDAETKKPRRRRKEHARTFDVESAHADLHDLARALARPAGFSARSWGLHLELWRGLLRGRGYDALAEDYGPDLAAIGIGQGEEPSGRTVARMVRVARDLVESALLDQLAGEQAATVRYALA